MTIKLSFGKKITNRSFISKNEKNRNFILGIKASCIVIFVQKCIGRMHDKPQLHFYLFKFYTL